MELYTKKYTQIQTRDWGVMQPVKCISRFDIFWMEPSTLRWRSTRNHWLETGSSAEDIVQLRPLGSFKITDWILHSAPLEVYCRLKIWFICTQRRIEMDFQYHSNWIETHLYFFLLRSVVSTLCLREVSWLWSNQWISIHQFEHAHLRGWATSNLLRLFH